MNLEVWNGVRTYKSNYENKLKSLYTASLLYIITDVVDSDIQLLLSQDASKGTIRIFENDSSTILRRKVTISFKLPDRGKFNKISFIKEITSRN